MLRQMVRNIPGARWLRGQVRQLLPDASPLRDWWGARQEIAAWKRNGCPVPPPSCVKYRTIKEYGRRHHLRVLVETGTYLGDAIQACLHSFSRIHSIELGEDLHRRAVERFNRHPHVRLWHGDSSEVLPVVLGQLDQPALFWLDGHYSAGITAKGDKETPIWAELEAILAHPVKGHVILIDDARMFDGTHDYPTVTAIQEYLVRHEPRASVAVAHDIIRVCLAR